MYRAVLDTCVLVPSLQRDFVLQLAAENAFAPQWSSGTMAELQEVLGRLDVKRGRTARPERHRRLVIQMRAAFPGAEIPAPRERAYPYGLRDRDDEHVLHAALMSGADAIVTDDLRSGLAGSPIAQEASIDVLSVADFVANTVAAHRDLSARALLEMFSRRTDPPAPSPIALLEQLCKSPSMGEVLDLLHGPVEALAQENMKESRHGGRPRSR